MIDFEDFEKIINVDVSKLKMHPKNSMLLPQLTKGELRRLKNRIKTYGFVEPIEINKNGYVLDGNNRIFKVLLPYQDELEIFKVPARVIDIEEEKEVNYIISKNFDRRQLSKLTQSYIRGKEYNTMKISHGGIRKKSSDKKEHLKTSKIIGDKYSVGESTIRKDGYFATYCDNLKSLTNDDFIFNLLNGEIKANKSLIIELSKQLDNTIKAVYDYYNNSIELELPALKEIMEKMIKQNKQDDKKGYDQRTIKIKHEYKNFLSELAKKENKNESEIINDALKFYIENQNKKT